MSTRCCPSDRFGHRPPIMTAIPASGIPTRKEPTMANRITLQHETTFQTAAHSAQLTGLALANPSPARRSASQLRRACQRGMATAEYAVGILAAVALALVLLKIFNDNEFFTTMLRFVLDLIGRVGGMVG